VSASIRQQSSDVMETARKAGIPPDDPLALLLAKLASLAETVSASDTERQEDLGRAMFRAGLTVARQLAVRVERRTAVAIGAAGVLVAVLSGGIGYAIGTTTARLPTISACWTQCLLRSSMVRGTAAMRDIGDRVGFQPPGQRQVEGMLTEL
jgi:hypothetical protein